jgi:hypothetical protein
LKAQWQAEALNEVVGEVETWVGSIYRADLIHYLRARAAASPAPLQLEGRCICDGGSYEVNPHPFIVHIECHIHGAAALLTSTTENGEN